jgi:alpha-tubulin suppressor-like RCC1 family protein
MPKKNPTNHFWEVTSTNNAQCKSVSLVLQHEIALDSMGQIFCWGKCEQGQLGQEKHLAREALKERCLDVSEKLRSSIDRQPQTYSYIRMCQNVLDVKKS